MYAGKTIFAQLMDCLPWSTFTRLVARYGGDYDVRTFPCVEQYRAMAFAQLTYRESLRDIEACLSAQPAKLYHMLLIAGFRPGPAWWNENGLVEDVGSQRRCGDSVTM